MTFRQRMINIYSMNAGIWFLSFVYFSSNGNTTESQIYVGVSGICFNIWLAAWGIRNEIK